ncbi:MAG: hypothetical protein K6G81_08235 [Lachnospiraceae bacterium]|nr:hypothetical protein [Lachnospiraceae bacterium]
MSIRFYCPACQKELFRYEYRMRKYGSILRKCRKCGADYIDPRYRELAFDGMPKDEFNIIPYTVGLVIGGLIAWRGWALFGKRQLGVPDAMQWLMPSTLLLIGAFLAIGMLYEIITIKTGLKMKKFEKLMAESRSRVSDIRYIHKLEQLGCEVPEMYRNP